MHESVEPSLHEENPLLDVMEGIGDEALDHEEEEPRSDVRSIRPLRKERVDYRMFYK